MGEPGRKPRVSEDEILSLFRETDDPVLSTAEVGEQLPITRRSAYNRLKTLRETGKLESKQIGGRNRVWWIVSDDSTSEGTNSETDESDKPEKGVFDY